MPLTDYGFQRQTYEDILDIQIERAKQLFGETIDTSSQSIFGKILRLYCLDAAKNQELAESVYLSAFPNTASGVSLDRLCPFAGITRNPATYAQHSVKITGTSGAVVEMGFLVSAGDVVFHTIDDYTIGTNGTALATVECNDSGTVGNVGLGDITDIVNPSADVTSITHTAVVKLAIDTETDYALRQRFSQTVLGQGSGTIDSIKSAILRVSGVESVLIDENSTSGTSGGLPAHSFQCYVLAPTSAKQAIAEAIFSKKPIGVTSFGRELVELQDESGVTHGVYFTFATEVTIYVKCTIKTNDAYSGESLQEIKDNIVKKLATYTNGQSVTATSLYGSIYVDGVEDVTSLTISSNGTSYSTNTISLAKSEVARTSAANIEVNTT